MADKVFFFNGYEVRTFECQICHREIKAKHFWDLEFHTMRLHRDVVAEEAVKKYNKLVPTNEFE